MKKKTKRKSYPTKLKVIILKAKHSEYRQMMKLAKKLANGNLSLLIRNCVLQKVS
jgi:hypothetical protein